MGNSAKHPTARNNVETGGGGMEIHDIHDLPATQNGRNGEADRKAGICE